VIDSPVGGVDAPQEDRVGSGEAAGGEARFSAYVERLSTALGHRDRERPFRAYCAGLLGKEGCKSVKPLAAATAPSRVSGQHQSLLHFVGQSEWSDAAVLAEGARLRPAGDRAARSDRGVDHRRYEFSQTGPTFGGGGSAILRATLQAGQLPECGDAFAYQSSRQPACRLSPLFAEGKGRGRAAPQTGGVPDDVVFETKTAIALGLLDEALAQNIARGFVLADAGYGSDTAFREALTALGLP
jgi:hypothetical protein